MASSRGGQGEAAGRTKYRWLYVYGFAHPASGRNLELVLPAADTDWMAAALAEFAPWADPAGEKLLVLLVDDAGWHVAKRLARCSTGCRRARPSCSHRAANEGLR